ncbi:MAG TPA: integrase [Nostoc sp.]|uniref:integrase n=1 Tax=Nostoc sp. TaxID=1180 RepID=UPI002D33036F|nr:integrase [Nostoc sp.]HYX13487.1 integrase [Nostoc sp.]
MKLTVEIINDRLKAAKIGVRVEARGDRLSLRATLPPKPGSSKTKPYQQYLALGIYANPAGLQRAEAEAKIVGGLLARGEFDWNRYLTQEQELGIGDWAEWIEKLRNDYFAQKGDTPNTQFTWKNDYEAAFKNLKGEVASASLIASATATPANSRSRKRTCEKLQLLAELAGVKVNLKPYIGNYGNSQTKPRNIPTDDEIVEARSLFDNSPSWLWAYGVMSVYGLRPHEIFHCEISKENLACNVLEGKTGERICYPLHPHWAEEWQLWQMKKPQCSGATYRDYGKRVTTAFWRRDVPFNPYDLRHAYCIRGSVKYKVPVAIIAAWCGHSPVVHYQTYSRWITSVEHTKVFEELRNQVSLKTPKFIN